MGVMDELESLYEVLLDDFRAFYPQLQRFAQEEQVRIGQAIDARTAREGRAFMQ